MVGVQGFVGEVGIQGVGCRGSGGQGVCGMYGLGINGGVKGPLQEYLTPCKVDGVCQSWILIIWQTSSWCAIIFN